jgi:hypothetical protein
MTQQRACVVAGTIGPVAAEHITEGSWTSRWGDWVVHLISDDNTWRVTVWRWMCEGRLDKRRQIGDQAGFPLATLAMGWACDLLRQSGARVFVIDKPSMKLESFLRFYPAPQDVT